MYLKKPYLRRMLVLAAACSAVANIFVVACSAVRAALAGVFRRRAVRRACAVCALAACLAFSGCSVADMPSLREFSKPYTGEYVCEYARCCGADLLSDLREVVLTLAADGTFTVTATPREGAARTATGKYEYDEQSGMLTLHAGKQDLQAALSDGKFTLTPRVAGLRLCARFARRV